MRYFILILTFSFYFINSFGQTSTESTKAQRDEAAGNQVVGRTPNTKSVNQGARNLKTVMSIGAGFAAAYGAMLIESSHALCSNPWTCGAGMVLAGIGAASIVQAGKWDQKKKEGHDIYCKTTGQQCSSNDPASIPSQITMPDGSVVKLDTTDGSFETPQVKVDAKTMTLTDKKTNKRYSLDDFSSPAAMAAAGMPQSSIDQAMAKADEIMKQVEADADKKLKAAGEGSDSFAGGGGFGGAKTMVVDQIDPAMAAAGIIPRNAVSERNPAALAGVSKDYHGEKIGVAANNIFLMMARRYQLKDKQDSFFGE